MHTNAVPYSDMTSLPYFAPHYPCVIITALPDAYPEKAYRGIHSWPISRHNSYMYDLPSVGQYTTIG